MWKYSIQYYRITSIACWSWVRSILIIISEATSSNHSLSDHSLSSWALIFSVSIFISGLLYRHGRSRQYCCVAVHPKSFGRSPQEGVAVHPKMSWPFTPRCCGRSPLNFKWPFIESRVLFCIGRSSGPVSLLLTLTPNSYLKFLTLFGATEELSQFIKKLVMQNVIILLALNSSWQDLPIEGFK